MNLVKAEEILNNVRGRSLAFLRAWGLDEVREAVRLVLHQQDRTKGNRELAEKVLNVIYDRVGE